MVQSQDDEVVLALSRFGLGSGSGGWRTAGRNARAALEREIHQGARALRIDAPLLSTPELLDEYYNYQSALKALRKQVPPNDGANLVNPAGARNLEEINARLTVAAMKPRVGFNERLVMFWSNHFAIAADKVSPVRITAGAFEREAIRPNLFGRFKDLVMAVETHPCMLTYLDNVTSVGPKSEGSKNGQNGLNENLAREIMELHLLGVGSGYTQADVTAFAAALTGWSVSKTPESSEGAGDGFDFIASNHEPGQQKVLGKVYSDPGFFQAADIILDLTARPATAHHIAFKLARYFVADIPPPALVDRLAANFLSTDGDLSALYLTLIDSEEAWQPECVKIRSPQEHLIAMMRASGVMIRPTILKQSLYAMGQQLWTPSGPNGFPDTVAAWATPEGLGTRMDVAGIMAAQLVSTSRQRTVDPRAFAQDILGPRLSAATATAVSHAETVAQGLALVFMSPEFLRR